MIGPSWVGEVVNYRFEEQNTSPRGKQSLQESLEIKQIGANTLTVKFSRPGNQSLTTIPVQRLADNTLLLGSEEKPRAGGKNSDRLFLAGSLPKRADGTASGQNGQAQVLVALQRYNQIARVAHVASGVPLQDSGSFSMTTTIGQGESLISIPLLVRVTEVSGNNITLEADGSGSGMMQLPKPSARSRRRRILRALLLGSLLGKVGGGFGSSFGSGGSLLSGGSNGGSVPVVMNVHYMAHFVLGRLEEVQGTEQRLLSVQGQNVNITSSWLLGVDLAALSLRAK